MIVVQTDVAAGEQFTPPDLPADVRLIAGVDLRAGQCVAVGDDGRMYPATAPCECTACRTARSYTKIWNGR